jgi:hypothetical protein
MRIVNRPVTKPEPKPEPAPKIRCREITAADLDDMANLLTRGFTGRPREYWVRGLARQTEREAPPGLPRYGYMLDCDGRAVGVLLLVCTTRVEDGQAVTRCNISSWYVEPEYRGFGVHLSVAAERHKGCTYVNVTPAPATWPIVEAMGFKRYCAGLFMAAPALSRSEPGLRVEVVKPGERPAGLSEPEAALLSSQGRYGCLSLVVRAADGEAMPFAFLPMRARSGRIALPAMTLIHCRDVADFVRCAGPIGRLLLARGKPVVGIDANGPIKGLAGIFTQMRGRKYFKGPHPPRLADLADTELVLFGP